MMNRYVQVANTYLSRPRFWVLAAAYPLVMWLAFESINDRRLNVQIHTSALMACLILCFVGLHVRRQFGSEMAQLVPGFPWPHLIVWALVSTFLWAGVPCGMMLAGAWPSGALAVHAVAGILSGAVACWARSISLLLALPVLLYWTSQTKSQSGSLLDRIIWGEGELPLYSATLITAAIAAHVLAAFNLTRLPRRGVPTTDELALDTTVAARRDALTDWLLSMRDQSAERLGRTRWLSGVQRWRVPVAVSPFHFLLPAAVVALISGMGWLAGNTEEWAVLATMITSLLLPAVPYSVWNSRRRMFSLELIRPVARRDYVRQIALALAWDVFLWTVVASLICICVFPRLSNESLGGFSTPGFVIGYLCVLWSMALFMYGVAVATIQRRAWPLLVAFCGMAWLIGMPSVVVLMFIDFGPHRSTIDPFPMLAVYGGVVGISLVWFSYRHWLTADVA